MRNLVRKELTLGSGTFTIPGGVNQITVYPQKRKLRIYNQTPNGGIVLDRNYDCWAWGVGTDGRNGDGSTTTRSIPVMVTDGHKFISVSETENFSIALKSDGTVWGWGENNLGQLGNNTTPAGNSVPTQVVGQSDFVQVVTGSNQSYGLKSDGTIWGWGRNNAGQLGNNTVIDTSSPVQVVGQSDFIQILGANNNVFAKKSDGTIWGWGSGNNGVFGNNTEDDYSSPTQITFAGGHEFIKIEQINGVVSGLKSNGTAWMWGLGTSGQIGDNTITSKSSPVQVVGQSDFIQIFPGSNTSAALKQDGTVWAWGNNASGALGNNSTTSTSSPVQIAGPHRFINGVMASSSASSFLKSNGEIWVCGSSGSGRLGNNNTSTTFSSVTQVVNEIFTPLDAEYSQDLTPSYTLNVTPGSTVNYQVGVSSFFDTENFGAGIEKIIVEYFA